MWIPRISFGTTVFHNIESLPDLLLRSHRSPSSSGDLSFTNSKVLSPFASTIVNFRSHLPVIKDNLHIPGL
jgi:hypothetical protein